jgi:hypothetical protein
VIRAHKFGGSFICCCAVYWCLSPLAFGSAPFQFGEVGSGAGQLSRPRGIAVDNSSGPSSNDIYIADQFNNRIDKFSSAGQFLLAWGWDVLNNSEKLEELQICTVVCLRGTEENFVGSLGTGAVTNPSGVATDSEGNVYVVEPAPVFRVEKFSEKGEFILTFGGEVNETTHGNICTEAEVLSGVKCKGGKEGSGNGFFEGLAFSSSSIAIGGPGDLVYVGDRARVQVFERNGVWKESFSLASLSNEGTVTALAVNEAGDVFVKDSDVQGVHEFEPNGTLNSSVHFDEGSSAVTSLTTDGKTYLYVGDATSGFQVLKYTFLGNIAGSFGSGTVGVSNLESPLVDMAYSLSGGPFGEVVATEGYCESSCHEKGWVLPIPPPGPFVEKLSSTPEPKGTTTLEGIINPEGNETLYHFEYVSETDFSKCGWSCASTTVVSSVPAGLEGKAVNVHITGLLVSTAYLFRILAENSEGITEDEGSFVSLPPAVIDSEYVSDVSSTGATLDAQVNPLGSSTEYELEYGTSISYGHAVKGTAGENLGDINVSTHLEGLISGMSYHYRFVLHNSLGTVAGEDRIFITQQANIEGECTLADCRVWELVSPSNKHGSLIEPFGTGLIQAAIGGHAVSYMATEVVGEGAAGKAGAYPQSLSTRVSPGIWITRGISIPHSTPSHEQNPASMYNNNEEYRLFSEDMSMGIVEPFGITPPLVENPQHSEKTLYLRNNISGSFSPLVTPEDVHPPGSFGPEVPFGGVENYEGANELHFLAATPDLDHVVFQSPFPLTENANNDLQCKEGPNCLINELQGLDNLYEWNGGFLSLVNVLPDGEAVKLGQNGSGGSLTNIHLGVEDQAVAHAISSDGRWIVWHTGNLEGGGNIKLFVRDMVGEKTFVLGGEHARFESMSDDGSRVFFLENGDLFVFYTDLGTTVDLTGAHGLIEGGAGVRDAVLGTSADGSYIYFVALTVLASGGIPKMNNLYAAHEAAGTWTASFVAVLSTKDEKDWYTEECNKPNCAVWLRKVTSRVSSSGRFLTFMSDRSLTGYDNTDLVSGVADEEVFLYDAVKGRVVCVSCDPSGARPVGVFDKQGVLADDFEAWEGHWLAGSLPGWYGNRERPIYQSRFLSDSGRVFFDSPVGLSPLDTNGLEDVYEFEPVGVGGCSSVSSGFSEVSDGCVGLVSSGISSTESGFMDASESGDDVFFVTTGKLVSSDFDNGYDVYDAHVCSVSVPCAVGSPSVPECVSTDSCRAAPVPQPSIFGAPSSATFAGQGNVSGSVPHSTVHKKLTGAQRLARALRACHAKKGKKKRIACERRTRKRFRVAGFGRLSGVVRGSGA